MQAAEVIAFTAFAWIASFTPGPNVAIAATTGVNHGLRAALPHIAGVPLGFVLMLWLVGTGGAALLLAHPQLLLLMKVAGNAYLLYLAYALCRSSELAADDAIKPFTLRQSALFQIVNPKAWMMLVAATSSYAIGQQDFILRMTVMSVGFTVPCVLSLVSWAWAGEKLRHWLLLGRRLRYFNLGMGLALALAATAIWMFQQ